MKKQIILSIVIALLAGTFVTASVCSQISMDTVLSENIEALAESEHEGTLCYNTITTAEGQAVCYCGTCSYISGKPTFFSGKSYCK